MQPHAKVDNDVRSARADGCLHSVTEACVRLIKVLHIVELHMLTLHTGLLWCATRIAAGVESGLKHLNVSKLRTCTRHMRVRGSGCSNAPLAR